MKVLCINDRVSSIRLRAWLHYAKKPWPLQAGQVYFVLGESRCPCHVEYTFSFSPKASDRKIKCRRCKGPVSNPSGLVSFNSRRFIPFPDEPKVSIHEVKALYEPTGTIQA